MLAHGVPAGRIMVTGLPRHDGLLNVAEADVARMRDQFGTPRGYCRRGIRLDVSLGGV